MKSTSTASAPKRSGGGFGPKKAYLVLYNAASAIAWATVLMRVVSTAWFRGVSTVPLVDAFARNTQTFAFMEILHALTGISYHPLSFPVQANSPFS